jgi:hypothetical protein
MKEPPSEKRGASPESEPTLRRPRITGALLVVTGLIHIVAPEVLLGLARQGYGSILKVKFDPLPEATTRVRMLGVGWLAAGAHLLYYGSIHPSGE